MKTDQNYLKTCRRWFALAAPGVIVPDMMYLQYTTKYACATPGCDRALCTSSDENHFHNCCPGCGDGGPHTADCDTEHEWQSKLWRDVLPVGTRGPMLNSKGRSQYYAEVAEYYPEAKIYLVRVINDGERRQLFRANPYHVELARARETDGRGELELVEFVPLPATYVPQQSTATQ